MRNQRCEHLPGFARQVFGGEVTLLHTKIIAWTYSNQAAKLRKSPFSVDDNIPVFHFVWVFVRESLTSDVTLGALIGMLVTGSVWDDDLETKTRRYKYEKQIRVTQQIRGNH